MRRIRYIVPLLSVRSLLACARPAGEGVWSFDLSRSETDSVQIRADAIASASAGASAAAQEDNALFYQAMCVLHGDAWQPPDADAVLPDLADVILYLDFAGIFDRDPSYPRAALRQKKAESLFRPEGITLDFGHGSCRYVAFERSASMSRAARLSFVRADVCDALRERIMLGMHIGRCQLSKLYAYNGLMFSSGHRIETDLLWEPDAVVVIANPRTTVPDVPVVTVEDETGEGSVRTYGRVERTVDVAVTEFDGEGMIDTTMSAALNRALGAVTKHTSFQIRMPYVKGMVHTVDFHALFRSASVTGIRDMWGRVHPVDRVHMILTESQCKGLGWLAENGMSFEDYLAACRRLRHALYVTGTNRTDRDFLSLDVTEINYQFLNTLSLTADEFRPSGLPFDWETDSGEHLNSWLTKESENTYWSLCRDESAQIRQVSRRSAGTDERHRRMADLMRKNYLLFGETYFQESLDAARDRVLDHMSKGQLLVDGMVLYLSGDLLALLLCVLRDAQSDDEERAAAVCRELETERLAPSEVCIPALRTGKQWVGLLRNPHVARNEEVAASAVGAETGWRRRLLAGLSGVVMVHPASLIAERLGGADYDGDMVKVITEPLIVKKLGTADDTPPAAVRGGNALPLLLIPAARPQYADANDWRARFGTVRSTFSSRVGQISNAALDRSVIAYDENTTDEAKSRLRAETETLAILTGLEIDSAKSGVKPDLSDYLGQRMIARSSFLAYKRLGEKAGVRLPWYEPRFREQYKAYFDGIDWEKVSANLERLPYVADQMKQCIPRDKRKPEPPERLFRFAQTPDWREKLDPGCMEAVRTVAAAYDAFIRRVRAAAHTLPEQTHRKDIERILFMRDQEAVYDAEELAALFAGFPAARASALMHAIREEDWAFLPPDERLDFLAAYLPDEAFVPYHPLLADFRCGGYRVLGDLAMDADAACRSKDNEVLRRSGDTSELTALLDAYLNRPAGTDVRASAEDTVICLLQARGCTPADAVRCAVAQDERDFMWDVLWRYVTEDDMLENVYEDSPGGLFKRMQTRMLKDMQEGMQQKLLKEIWS